MTESSGDAPVWRQIAETIRSRINDGVYRPGQLIPSETHLSQEFGVNRHTARQATRVLRDEGLLTVRRGDGTRVRVPAEPSVLEIPIGSRIGSRMPTQRERRELGMADGVPMLTVTTLRSVMAYPADRYILAPTPGVAP